MKASRLALGALGLAALAACSQNPGPAKEEVVAMVDGQPIGRNTFEQYVQGVASKPVGELTQVQRDTLLDNLVRAAVVAAETRRSGVAAKRDVTGAIEIQRLLILDRAAAEDHLKDYQPSEEELRAEYDLRVAMMDKVHYQLSHIQLESAEEATSVIERLGKGANFAALAREHSRDEDTREKGGELPFVAPSAMPPSFAVAVRTMKKGDTSPSPVRTDIGWHVIRLMDTRNAEVPPMDTVRGQLIQAVREKKFTAWTDGLVAKAKITKTP